MHGDRHLPRALAQRRLQLLQHAHVAGEPGQPPLELERVLEAAQVARGVVHVGRLHFDVVQAHHGVELDVVRLGGLAHDLAVHLAVGRHVDDDIAQHLRRAREPPSRPPADGRGRTRRSTAPNGDRFAAREVTPCFANSPSASTTWQRPHIPRPPQTESMSTPSERAACSSGVPSGKRPRLPEGVKTTNASVVVTVVASMGERADSPRA